MCNDLTRVSLTCYQVLAAFVDSLDKDSDQKMVSRHREWERLVQVERLALAKAESGNRGGPAECSGSVRKRCIMQALTAVVIIR